MTLLCICFLTSYLVIVIMSLSAIDDRNINVFELKRTI